MHLDPDTYRRLRQAREFIDDCLDQDLSLDRIAREACLSAFHFQRLFRSTYELTPHQYVTRRRVERARELLVYTSLEVSEICLLVGFHSLGSFSSLFTRHTGLSPSCYRRRFSSGFLIDVLHPDMHRLFPSCFLLMYGSDHH